MSLDNLLYYSGVVIILFTLLMYPYATLDMFRATRSPSSGADDLIVTCDVCVCVWWSGSAVLSVYSCGYILHKVQNTPTRIHRQDSRTRPPHTNAHITRDNQIVCS